jgi:hypothetical protein
LRRDVRSGLAQKDLGGKGRVNDKDHRRNAATTAVVSSPPASMGSMGRR